MNKRNQKSATRNGENLAKIVRMNVLVPLSEQREGATHVLICEMIDISSLPLRGYDDTQDITFLQHVQHALLSKQLQLTGHPNKEIIAVFTGYYVYYDTLRAVCIVETDDGNFICISDKDYHTKPLNAKESIQYFMPSPYKEDIHEEFFRYLAADVPSIPECKQMVADIQEDILSEARQSTDPDSIQILLEQSVHDSYVYGEVKKELERVRKIPTKV